MTLDINKTLAKTACAVTLVLAVVSPANAGTCNFNYNVNFAINATTHVEGTICTENLGAMGASVGNGFTKYVDPNIVSFHLTLVGGERGVDSNNAPIPFAAQWDSSDSDVYFYITTTRQPLVATATSLTWNFTSDVGSGWEQLYFSQKGVAEPKFLAFYNDDSYQKVAYGHSLSSNSWATYSDNLNPLELGTLPPPNTVAEPGTLLLTVLPLFALALRSARRRTVLPVVV